MINLLSAEKQNQYRAARLNLRLRGYSFLLLSVLVGVAVIFGGGLYLTYNERTVAEADAAKNSELIAEYTAVRSRAEAFTKDLKVAKSILSQEVLYSDMITRIAQTLPSSAILTSLSIDQTTLGKPVQLAARVKTKNDSIVLKSTLENSPIFENVSINSITEETILPSEKNPTKIAHPVSVTLTVTFSKGAPGSLLP